MPLRATIDVEASAGEEGSGGCDFVSGTSGASIEARWRDVGFEAEILPLIEIELG